MSSGRKILLHALGISMGGARRHLQGFLPALAANKTQDRYVLLVRDVLEPGNFSGAVEAEKIPQRTASSWPRRFYYDNCVLPKKIRREKFSAVVTLTNFGPIHPPVPHIVFERNALYFSGDPSALPWPVSRSERWEYFWRRRVLIETVKRAEVIVTPSRAMMDRILSDSPRLKSKKFRVIRHGISPKDYLEPLGTDAGRALNREGMKLLFAGHPAAHKGFEVLLRVLRLIRDRGAPAHLFLTCSREDWPEGIKVYERQIRRLGLESCVHFLGRIPSGQMGEVYRTVDLVVCSSFCESFGFPLLEAMAFSAPLVASDLPVHREVAGEAALYYPAPNAEAGAEQVLEALRPQTRERLRKACQHRMSAFDWSWERYVGEFLDLVDKEVPA